MQSVTHEVMFFSRRRVTRSAGETIDTIPATAPPDSVSSGSTPTSSSSASPDASCAVIPRNASTAKKPSSQEDASIIPSINGYLYTTGRAKPLLRSFQLKPRAFYRFGNRLIPSVRIQSAWTGEGRIHRAFVTLGDRIFLVYGYTLSTDPINIAISSLKKTTEWRGEIVAFAVGVKKPILKTPTSPRGDINKVASLFVSRVTESVDLGLQPPRLIQV